MNALLPGAEDFPSHQRNISTMDAHTQEMETLEREHLALLLQASELLGSSLDIQEILDRLMDQVISVIKAKRGFVLMRDEEDGELKFRSARAINQNDLDGENFRISKSVIEKVEGDGSSILTSDAMHDGRFKGQKSIMLHDLKSILCVPLIIQGRILGVIYADHPMETYVFGAREKTLLESIARQAAVALENARLYETLKRVHEESMVKARKELKETQAQLFQSSKMAAVGQLAAGIAHEINNPLGAIALNATSIKKYVQDEKLAKRISIIENATFKCKNIVEKLLRFSHPSSRTPELVNIGELVSSTLLLTEYQLSKQDIRLEKRIPEDLAIYGDMGELSQVLMNILMNAKDALLQRAKEQGRIIVIESFRKEGTVQILISDNGSGMDDAVIERIFEPFFTTKDVGDGVGLGLSISFQIVRKYDGEIRVESSPGEGSRFTLSFPAAE